jgi:hypothetical protein
MAAARTLVIVLPLLVGGVLAAAYMNHRSGMATAERAWHRISSGISPPTQRFSQGMLEGQPEIARRYFAHAIADGTPLPSTVELEMRGTFLLGDKRKYQTYSMHARQILRPPYEFVWMPTLRSGLMSITGSDGLVSGRAWTRLWLLKLIPVANVRTSPDMVRSAAFRAASEGLWLPASLLPANDVRWVQTGPDTAQVTIGRTEPPITLQLSLARNGAVRSVVGQRWSNANPEKRFRLQPFGGTVADEITVGGFTIPAKLKVGNHYGTRDYLPFFQAEVITARYQ